LCAPLEFSADAHRACGAHPLQILSGAQSATRPWWGRCARASASIGAGLRRDRPSIATS